LSLTVPTLAHMFDSQDVSDPPTAEAVLVDRIADLERSKSASAAEQAELTAELDTLRRAREANAPPLPGVDIVTGSTIEAQLGIRLLYDAA
jgi:hypothetical protein